MSRARGIAATCLCLTAFSWGASAFAASSWSPSLLVNTEGFQVIDDDDTTADIVLRFGDTINKSLTYERTAGQFRFDDDLEILGTASGTTIHANTLLRSSGSLVTESGAYIDGTLVVQAGNNRVGIGTASPDTPLDVVGTVSGSSVFTYDLVNSRSATSGSVLVSRTANTPEWKSPTGAVMWYIDGDLTIGNGKSAVVIMPFGMTVTDVDLKVKTAPTGQQLIVDINEQGSTIFSTRPEIDAAATREDGNHALSDTSLAAGAEITIDIDQVGSGTAGNGLTIMLKGVRAY